MSLVLVSHYLCPYVQRAAISLSEKGVEFERCYVDLGNKPDWFHAISPLGKTPVLIAGDTPIFESAVILEYLEETQPDPLHPANPIERAKHRGWVEYGSTILDDIGAFYGAKDETAMVAASERMTRKFERLETVVSNGPFFGGGRFCLVDAVYGPVFRYFDVFDRIANFGVFDRTPKIRAWREQLRGRPSVATAVTDDYGERLSRFIDARDSHLSELQRK